MSDSSVPWTVAFQSPLSKAFLRQEYWSGVTISFSRASSHSVDRTHISFLAGGFFTTESCFNHYLYYYLYFNFQTLFFSTPRYAYFTWYFHFSFIFTTKGSIFISYFNFQTLFFSTPRYAYFTWFFHFNLIFTTKGSIFISYSIIPQYSYLICHIAVMYADIPIDSCKFYQ